MSSDQQDKLPTAKVLRSDEVKSPEVHTWKFVDLAQDKNLAEEKLREAMYQRIQRELEPKFQQQATLLKKEAFEEAKQDGFEAGYQAGFETGQVQGLEKAQESVKETLAPKIERLNSLVSEIVNPYQFISQQVFEQLAQISIALAEKLVGDHFQAKPEMIVQLVEKSIAVLPNPEAHLTLELNPADIELIDYYYQQQPPRNWQMQPNPALEQGSCVVKSLDTLVASNWREQLAELLAGTDNLAKSLVQNAQPDLVAGESSLQEQANIESSPAVDNPS